jgi:hypothetical protein
MSFGLNSNDCTHLYLQHESALFYVKIENNEEVLYVKSNGTDARRFVSTAAFAYGLILRYRPDPDDHPERAWFLCAGLGAKGTTGAAWYLANKWKHFLQRQEVGKDDFIAVIKVPMAADRDSSLVHCYISRGADLGAAAMTSGSRAVN